MNDSYKTELSSNIFLQHFHNGKRKLYGTCLRLTFKYLTNSLPRSWSILTANITCRMTVPSVCRKHSTPTSSHIRSSLKQNYTISLSISLSVSISISSLHFFLSHTISIPTHTPSLSLSAMCTCMNYQLSFKNDQYINIFIGEVSH